MSESFVIVAEVREPMKGKVRAAASVVSRTKSPVLFMAGKMLPAVLA